MENIIAALMPHLLEITAALLSALIGWAANTARIRWGVQIDADHREALHRALMTGATLALGRNVPDQVAVDIAINHAKASVPDALRKLAPSKTTLETIARAKLAEAIRK